jgi:hypothetical protein
MRMHLRRFRMATIVAVALQLPAACVIAAPQVIEAPNVVLPFNTINEGARAPIVDVLTKPELDVRLQNGGQLELDAMIKVGDPNFSKSATVYMALDELNIKKGGGFITGGNTLVIFANSIKSEDGQIVAFTSDDSTAKSGPGDEGGVVQIFVVKDFSGRLHVDLGGQKGAAGSPGAQGANGPPGVKGDASVSNPACAGCAKGGGNGSPGSPGAKGGRGGDGGVGGHGGKFFLYNVGQNALPAAAYDFVANPGIGGAGGPGGPGGTGGAGGDGGDGSCACDGGHPGAKGADGPSGDGGDSGKDGAPGTKLVKAVPLEFVLEAPKKTVPK